MVEDSMVENSVNRRLDLGTYLFGTVWFDDLSCRFCLNSAYRFCLRCDPSGSGWWFIYDPK